MSALMTVSSHRHVADVGGTCCLRSGSDAQHGTGQGRCSHAEVERRGNRDLSPSFSWRLNHSEAAEVLRRSSEMSVSSSEKLSPPSQRHLARSTRGGARPTEDTAGVAALT